MLRELTIDDILLFDHLSLQFDKGLNVLTGETGAGKSIILDSLGFVLGWRGRADIVRQGASQGQVIAVFDIADNSEARAVLDDAGIPSDDELILRRVSNADGRKKAYINDRPVSGELLRTLGDSLLELHGQHDDRGLLDIKGHITLLDAFGNFDLTPIKNAAKARRHSEKALQDFLERAEAAAREADYIRHSFQELNALSPQMGEDAELEAARFGLQQGAKLSGAFGEVLAHFDYEGAYGAFANSLRQLARLSEQTEGRLDDVTERLGSVIDELADIGQSIEAVSLDFEVNPARLDAVEERLFALRALARKHNVTPDALEGLTEEFRVKLDSLENAGTEEKALRAARDDALEAYENEAAKLHSARVEAAKALDAAVMKELAPLKMENAIFQTEVETSRVNWGSLGSDDVRFVVATNPGAPFGALNKIASGGELSRFLLALKVALQKGATARTIIFDEIDRGVGGQTADAVGRRLKSLANKGQLLVVTHSPQVAAKSDMHFVVNKLVKDDMTFTKVSQLNHDASLQEIARMISGDRITEEAVNAARALVSQGQNEHQ